MIRLSSKHLYLSYNLFFGKQTYTKYNFFSTQELSKLNEEPKIKWNQILQEAKDTVGYHTSLLNLRNTLIDEMASVVTPLNDVIEIVIDNLEPAIKNILTDDQDAGLNWKLIILLLCKTAGHVYKTEIEETEVIFKQKALAEIAELFNTSYLIHRCILNVDSDCKNPKRADLFKTNMITILIGDYLLSKSFSELAQLRKHDVISLIGQGIRDQYNSEFIGVRDKQNLPLPSKPLADSDSDIPKMESLSPDTVLGHAEAEWTLHHVLAAGSLVGKACESALNLAGLSPGLQQQAFNYGKHIFLAWQAYLDRKIFQNTFNGPFSIISAPVFYHLKYDPMFYKEIENGKTNVYDIDYETVHEAVARGPGLQKTSQLQKYHCDCVRNILTYFPESQSKNLIKNILQTMSQI